MAFGATKPAPTGRRRRSTSHCNLTRVKGHMSNTIIEETFQRLYGQPCWGIHFDPRLNLSLNFGKPSLRIREPYRSKAKSEVIQRLAARRSARLRGQWWLWMFCSYWRLSSHGTDSVTGSCSNSKIQRALVQLSGQKLVSATIKPATGATRFAFDLGCLLECRRFAQDDADLWTLYKPSGYTLSVHGDGTMSHHRGSRAKKQFRPIEDR